MTLTAPSINDLFADVPENERLERFEAYKTALSACHQKERADSVHGPTGKRPMKCRNCKKKIKQTPLGRWYHKKTKSPYCYPIHQATPK